MFVQKTAQSNYEYNDLPLDDAFDKFIKSREAMMVTDQTLKYYNYHLSRILQYLKTKGIKKVSEINSDTCDGFFTYMRNRRSIQGIKTEKDNDYFGSIGDSDSVKLSGSYLNCYGRVLKTFLLYLLDHEIIPRYPKFKLPKIEKKAQPYFTDKQIKKMLITNAELQHSYITRRNEVLILFSVDSGLRLQEMSNLNWKDITLLDGQVKVIGGKGKKDRVVGIGIKMMRIMTSFKEQTKKFLSSLDNPIFNIDYSGVFLTEVGTRLSPRGIDSIYERLGQKVSINISSHAFRRSCARNLLLAEKNLIYIQTQLGHEDIKQTRSYIEGLTPELHVQEIQRGGSAVESLIDEIEEDEIITLYMHNKVTIVIRNGVEDYYELDGLSYFDVPEMTIQEENTVE